MSAKRYPRAGVATPHYLASAAGLATLARGGNAIDAAVAANLTLGVVAPYFCGYGGDLFAVVWDGSLHGYLGSGRASAATSIDTVRAATTRGGNAPGRSDRMPTLGPHAVTVPGAVSGWFDLLDRWGTRSFGELAELAVQYAREGFELTTTGAQAIEWACLLYEDFDAFLTVYRGHRPGDVVRQPALARTIEALAEGGPEAYYRGPIAGAIEAATGGALATEDLATHAGRWADPLLARYRDLEIAELPPPTQGVTALEALRILDGLALPEDGVDRHHLMLEALKLALADRDEYVTDPDAMPLLVHELLDDEWVAARRTAIDPEHAGAPTTGIAQLGGTAYLCAADGDGLLVSLIQSNFLAFGSGVHVPEWGINLNNRGSSFSLDPARANVLAPAKLPMHTLIPAMALRDGAPALVFGTMGADAQAQVQVQMLVRIVDDGADPQDAIDGPRWRIDPDTWRIGAEPRFGDGWFEGLTSRGHELVPVPWGDVGMGHAHAIAPTGAGYAVATDWRAEGAALGL